MVHSPTHSLKPIYNYFFDSKMSIRELLDDGAVPASWKKLAVSSLRSLVSNITGNLNVGGNLGVTGNLQVAGDSEQAQIYTPIGIRLGGNFAVNNLNRYLILESGGVVVPNVDGALSARYVRVGRQSTLFIYNPAGSLFTIVGGPHPQIDFTFASMGAGFQAALEGGAGDITGRAPSTIICDNLTGLLLRAFGGNTEVTIFNPANPAAGILAGFTLPNFSITWVSN